MQSVEEDGSIIIKLVDEGSSVVVQYREYYLVEGYKQLSDTSTMLKSGSTMINQYRNLQKRVIIFFLRLCNNKLISKKELEHFSYNFKNTICLGKMLKFKNLGNIPSNVIIVTVDVVGLYPSVPHDAGLQALYEKLEERRDKKFHLLTQLKQLKFILKNNVLEFDTKIIQQISGTTIGTKFAPSYACYFIDRMANDFLELEIVKPWLRLRYIDDIFFMWTEDEDQLERFLNRLDNFHPNLKGKRQVCLLLWHIILVFTTLVPS